MKKPHHDSKPSPKPEAALAAKGYGVFLMLGHPFLTEEGRREIGLYAASIGVEVAGLTYPR